jgi:hypothetical protein
MQGDQQNVGKPFCFGYNVKFSLHVIGTHGRRLFPPHAVLAIFAVRLVWCSHPLAHLHGFVCVCDCGYYATSSMARCAAEGRRVVVL